MIERHPPLARRDRRHLRPRRGARGARGLLLLDAALRAAPRASGRLLRRRLPLADPPRGARRVEAASTRRRRRRGRSRGAGRRSGSGRGSRSSRARSSAPTSSCATASSSTTTAGRSSATRFSSRFTPCDGRSATGARGPASGPRGSRRSRSRSSTSRRAARSCSIPTGAAGACILERLASTAHQAVDAGVPRAAIDRLAREPASARALAKLAIATELLLGVGLWPRRTRAFALWWGVWFHLTIEATSRVEGFTWLTLAVYALFATPDVARAQARLRRVAPARRAARARRRAARLARAVRGADRGARRLRRGPRRRGRARRDARDRAPRPRRDRAVHAAALPALARSSSRQRSSRRSARRGRDE